LLAATAGAVVVFIGDVAGQPAGLSHAGLLTGIAAVLAAAASFAARFPRSSDRWATCWSALVL
jgi:hypothetical protein